MLPERELLTERTEEHSYIYAGGKLLRETVFIVDEQGSEIERTLDFRYDNVGFPYALHYTDTFEGIEQTYYYVTNLQGDVMYMVDEGGGEVASYDYDPYGKLLYARGDMAEVNPIRYRGYYYDTETDFYYLQSRYYDPTICRFISSDSYTSTGQGIVGYNMFAYCLNNPIVYNDTQGDYSYYIIGNVTTVNEGLDKDNTTIYRTTMEYTWVITDPNSIFMPECRYDGKSEFVFNLDDRGVVIYDNDKNDRGMSGAYEVSIALAQEMYLAATTQVEGALSGRTIEGLARELRAHTKVSTIIPWEKVSIADMGGTTKDRPDYDYNASWFEGRILAMLF